MVWQDTERLKAVTHNDTASSQTLLDQVLLSDGKYHPGSIMMASLGKGLLEGVL